jgi:hypothetical protein
MLLAGQVLAKPAFTSSNSSIVISALCTDGHTVQQEENRLLFADAAHAERFRARFGGEPFDPKDRGRGSAWLLWRKRQPGRGA